MALASLHSPDHHRQQRDGAQNNPSCIAANIARLDAAQHVASAHGTPSDGVDGSVDQAGVHDLPEKLGGDAEDWTDDRGAVDLIDVVLVVNPPIKPACSASQ